jgi:hypothetical protein
MSVNKSERQSQEQQIDDHPTNLLLWSLVFFLEMEWHCVLIVAIGMKQIVVEKISLVLCGNWSTSTKAERE